MTCVLSFSGDLREAQHLSLRLPRSPGHSRAPRGVADSNRDPRSRRSTRGSPPSRPATCPPSRALDPRVPRARAETVARNTRDRACLRASNSARRGQSALSLSATDASDFSFHGRARPAGHHSDRLREVTDFRRKARARARDASEKSFAAVMVNRESSRNFYTRRLCMVYEPRAASEEHRAGTVGREGCHDVRAPPPRKNRSGSFRSPRRKEVARRAPSPSVGKRNARVGVGFERSKRPRYLLARSPRTRRRERPRAESGSDPSRQSLESPSS